MIRFSSCSLVLWGLFHSLNSLPFFSEYWHSGPIQAHIQSDEQDLYGRLFYILRGAESVWAAAAVFAIQIVSGLAVLKRKWIFPSSLVVSYATLVLFASHPYGTDGDNNIAQLFLYFLPLLVIAEQRVTPEGASSVSKIRNSLAHSAHWVCRLQLLFVYFTAGFYKLNGKLWQEGTSIFYILQNPDFGTEWTTQFVHTLPMISIVMTYSTVAFQVSFPFFVWFKKLRPLLFLAGAGLHLGIAFMMGLAEFGLILIVAYTFWFTPSWFEFPSWKELKNLTVGIDETCSLCQTFGRTVASRSHGRITIDGAWSPVHPQLASIPLSVRTSSIHAVLDNQTTVQGIEAVEALLYLARFRLLFLGVRLLRIFGVGEAVYRLLAEGRKRCGDGKCGTQIGVSR